MDEKVKENIIRKNLLLKVQSGSHLYGLNTPESDIDYLGVIYEPFKYKLGFSTFGELDVSVKDKLENGRNSKYAIDEKYYSLTKFVELLCKNNPTIIELLFAQEAEIREPIIDKLYEHRMDFLSFPKIENGFIGYAISQEKKMEIKSENLDKISKFYDLIKDITVDGVSTVIDVFNKEPILKKYLEEYKNHNKKVTKQYEEAETRDDKKKYYKLMGQFLIGTRTFSVNILFKKFKTQLEQIVNQKSNRSVLVDKYGYDTKFFSHTVRLLDEGLELLETGDLKFPLRNKEFLLDCKLGKFSYDEAMEIIKEYKEKIRNFDKSKSPISKNTNKGRIENLVLDFYKEAYGITD